MVLKALFLPVLLLAALVLTSAYAQIPTAQLSFDPSQPTSRDVLRITIYTNDYCDAAGPTDSISVSVTSGLIRINARLTCAPLGPIMPFVFSRNVGPLPAGTYAVQYWADHSIGPTSSGLILRGSSAIVVTQGIEAIPMLTPWLVLLLIPLLLVLAAFKRIG